MMRLILRFANRCLPVFAIVALNVWLARELLVLSHSIYVGSIDSTFIALGRFLIQQWPDVSWYPYWYAGTTFQNAYPPVMAGLVASWASIGHLSPEIAYRQIAAAIYYLTPAALYLLAVHLGARRGAAALASVLYSLVSPCALLVQEIRLDLGSPWRPRRLENLITYGEGPHQLSILLLPLALIAIDRALKRPAAARLFLAAVAMGAVAATNWFSAFALAISILCLWLCRGHGKRQLFLTAAFAALAYGLVCVLLPPDTILTIQRNSRHLTHNYSLWAILLTALPSAVLLLLASRWVFRRRQASAAVQFFAYWLMLFGPIVLGAFWFQKFLLPQATRYQLELDVALIFTATLAGYSLIRSGPKWLQYGALTAIILFGLFQVRQTREWARAASANVDPHSTIEYQIAAWSRSNAWPNRIYLSGSPCFWLNVWVDVPQLEGDFNNGVISWPVAVVDEVVNSASADTTLLWLRAFGVAYAEMVGDKSRNFYHWMKNPGKFAGKLTIARHEPDDTIYALCDSHCGLAHAVSRNDLVAHPPSDALDIAEIRKYVSAIDSEEHALALQWTSNHSFEVRGDFSRDKVLSVQETWHPAGGLQLPAARLRSAGTGLV